ncbi:MAG: hypothetical protein K0S53_147 [Bacteroidetes bacterium]|jgi:hypothetical protein|nr:hypothetical protein [Bacteroidota bacterium]MDF2453793.1 hypothetical protein [Bacteroidota bacterium]
MTNKIIPLQYKEPIMTALSSYPELEDCRIHFKLTNKHSVPYGTAPTFSSLFKKTREREYTVTLLEEASEPDNSALFKNLSLDKQEAVIAHELFHVLQFQNATGPRLLTLMLLYPLPSFKRKIERAADSGAIDRGYGSGLYNHAVYLRSIPGYVQKRPEIEKYYLQPNEIILYNEKIKTH